MRLGRRTQLAATASAAMLMMTPSGVIYAEQTVAGTVAPSNRPAASTQAITLITGDRLLIARKDMSEIGVVPGAGREKVAFRTHRSGNRVEVIPSDVARLVASGRLDRRLFDVTTLLASDYHDKATADIPLIVSYEAARGRTTVRAAGATVARELPAINGSAVRVAKAKAAGFLTRLPDTQGRFGGGIKRVWLDAKRRISLDRSVPQIGAPAAWQAGYTGSGVTVAVLDTGVDGGHPDLSGRVAEARNFSQSPDGDGNGHGTHVAGTIAGTASASAGRYKGVAPDATLLDGKVCEDGGWCTDSAILAGMQWAATEKRADVINLSLGSTDAPEIDPLEQAVNTLTAQTGALFVVAAGNQGPAAGTVGSPGSADAALTVGAVDSADQLVDFSSRGPRVGDGAIKPDVTAPGLGIVAARAGRALIGEPVGDAYLRLSGTSMATPHVAGAVALLAQQHPDWTAPQLKSVVMNSAQPQPGQTVFEQGAGRVDVAAAITQRVLARPGSLSFGTARWPHDDDAPVVREVTYENLGTDPVTLSLQATLIGPDGQPAPSGALSVTTGSLTIPAGESANVAVTSNTNHSGPDGTYGGRVTATTASGATVVTPLTVTREAESHDLTVTQIAPDGTPASNGLVGLTDLDTGWEASRPVTNGRTTVRLPKGRYILTGSQLVTVAADQFNVHKFVQPVLTMSADASIVLDARQTKRIKTTVPPADARRMTLTVGFELVVDGRFVQGAWLLFDPQNEMFTRALGDPVSAPDSLTAYVNSVWSRPDELNRNSPYSYQLWDTRRGSFFTGMDRAATSGQLARLATSYHVQADGLVSDQFLFGRPAGIIGSLWAPGLSYDQPGRAVHFVDPGNITWRSTLWDAGWDNGPGIPVSYLESPRRTFRPGEVHPERWNAAVIAPCLLPFANVARTAVRTGDRMDFAVGFQSDPQHPGFSNVDSSSGALYRDGVQIPRTEGGYRVPAGPAEFRLDVSFSRPSVSRFSTSVDTSWRFRSDTASSEGEDLPMWWLRYQPPVDGHNSVARTPVSMVPIALQPNPGARVGAMRTVELQASGDDGTTWTTATVRRVGANQYVAEFRTPTAAPYISLKAKAVDTDGNAIEQTVVRAYAVR